MSKKRTLGVRMLLQPKGQQLQRKEGRSERKALSTRRWQELFDKPAKHIYYDLEHTTNAMLSNNPFAFAV